MSNTTMLYQVPAEEGFFMPAEFAPHHGTLLIWPERPGSWGKNREASMKAYVDILKALAPKEHVYLMGTEAGLREAAERLEAVYAAMDAGNAETMRANIHPLQFETDDSWARDTGATFVLNPAQTERRGISWQFNAWGGEYDGLYASWDKDQLVAEAIAAAVGDACYDASHFVLEGGSIHSDGEGTLLVTEECLLSPGRNPQLDREGIEAELKKYLNVETIIWLPYGIFQDETNGHVDNICAFTAPGEVILAWCEDPEDPQYERSMADLKVLEAAVDAKGRRLKIHKLLTPKTPVCINQADVDNFIFEEGEDEREAGERLAASYVNFYIANGVILAPQFGDPHDALAIEKLKECFPTREVVGIDSRAILTGGGNIHCITQQIPAVKEA